MLRRISWAFDLASSASFWSCCCCCCCCCCCGKAGFLSVLPTHLCAVTNTGYASFSAPHGLELPVSISFLPGAATVASAAGAEPKRWEYPIPDKLSPYSPSIVKAVPVSSVGRDRTECVVPLGVGGWPSVAVDRRRFFWENETIHNCWRIS